RMIFRLPPGSELGPNAAPQRATIVRRERRIQPIEKELRDVLLLAQDRAAGALRGVRSEHGLDAQAADERQHVIERQTLFLQMRERRLHAARLRTFAVLHEVLAPPTD